MALLFADGFDHQERTFTSQIKWDYKYYDDFDFGEGYGSTGGWGMRITGNTSTRYATKSIYSTDPTTIVGFRYKCDEVLNPTFLKIGVVSWYCDFSNLYMELSDVLAYTLPAPVIKSDVWCYLEFKVYVHATAGTVEVRKDGETIVSLTGLNTKGSGGDVADKLTIYGRYNRNSYFDDLYMCDTLGTECNDFLGDIGIHTLYPISDGSVNDFTPSTGTDHFAVVDDPHLSDEATYLTGSVAGNKELFNMTELSATGDIHAVQISAFNRNASVGGSTLLCGLTKSGTIPTEQEGVAEAVSQTFLAHMSIFEKEPTDDVAWTASKVNAAEFGLKIQS